MNDLVSRIPATSQLNMINLALNQFSSEGCVTAVCAMVLRVSTLNSLNIDGNLIGDSGAALITSSLEPALHLRELSISHAISKESFAAVLNMIASHKPKVSTLPIFVV